MKGSIKYLDPLLYDHYQHYNENYEDEAIIYDLFKADIFSLGVVFLECVTGMKFKEMSKTEDMQKYAYNKVMKLKM